MKRAAGLIGILCVLLALLLVALSVREEVVIVALLVIALVGLAFTVGGRAGAAISD